MVNLINNLSKIQLQSLLKTNNSASQAKFSEKADANGKVMETVTLTQAPETAQIYSSPISSAEISDMSFGMLSKLVTNLLKEQGIPHQLATTGSTTIDITTLNQEQAQELVADDGYFGIEQTSDRIVNFALSLAGGDTGKLDVIKEGVEHGFKEALEAFRGTLPDISYETYDVVIYKLDAWAAKAHSQVV